MGIPILATNPNNGPPFHGLFMPNKWKEPYRFSYRIKYWGGAPPRLLLRSENPPPGRGVPPGPFGSFLREYFFDPYCLGPPGSPPHPGEGFPPEPPGWALAQSSPSGLKKKPPPPKEGQVPLRWRTVSFPGRWGGVCPSSRAAQFLLNTVNCLLCGGK